MAANCWFLNVNLLLTIKGPSTSDLGSQLDIEDGPELLSIESGDKNTGNLFDVAGQGGVIVFTSMTRPGLHCAVGWRQLVPPVSV